jgi:hypothetical protein
MALYDIGAFVTRAVERSIREGEAIEPRSAEAFDGGIDLERRPRPEEPGPVDRVVFEVALAHVNHAQNPTATAAHDVVQAATDAGVPIDGTTSNRASEIPLGFDTEFVGPHTLTAQVAVRSQRGLEVQLHRADDVQLPPGRPLGRPKRRGPSARNRRAPE